MTWHDNGYVTPPDTLDQVERERSAVASCRAALEATPYSPEAAGQLEEAADAARGEVRRCKERVDALSAQLGGAQHSGSCLLGMALILSPSVYSHITLTYTHIT